MYCIAKNYNHCRLVLGTDNAFSVHLPLCYKSFDTVLDALIHLQKHPSYIYTDDTFYIIDSKSDDVCYETKGLHFATGTSYYDYKIYKYLTEGFSVGMTAKLLDITEDFINSRINDIKFCKYFDPKYNSFANDNIIKDIKNKYGNKNSYYCVLNDELYLSLIKMGNLRFLLNL